MTGGGELLAATTSSQLVDSSLELPTRGSTCRQAQGDGLWQRRVFQHGVSQDGIPQDRVPEQISFQVGLYGSRYAFHCVVCEKRYPGSLALDR